MFLCNQTKTIVKIEAGCQREILMTMHWMSWLRLKWQFIQYITSFRWLCDRLTQCFVVRDLWSSRQRAKQQETQPQERYSLLEHIMLFNRHAQPQCCTALNPTPILLQKLLHSLAYWVLHSWFCFGMLHLKRLILRWFHHNCHSKGKRWQC